MTTKPAARRSTAMAEPRAKPATPGNAGEAAAKPLAAAVPAKTVAAQSPRRPVPTAGTDAEKADKKTKKPKLVRDSFTIPKAEYGVLDMLKQRATALTRPAKKSELLRAGIKALAAMPDAAFLAALQAVPAIKTGRPSAA